MKSPWKILFITHEVSRTGAPIILLQFLEWVNKKNLDIEISLLTLKTGVLKERFMKSANRYYELSDYQKVPLTFLQDIKKRFLRKIGNSSRHPQQVFFDELGKVGYDLIYANSVVSLPVAKRIKDSCSSTKLLVHIHELSSIIKSSGINIQNFVVNIDAFIAVSRIVENELVKDFSIPNEKIKTIYEFSNPIEETKIRKNSGFVLGGAGTVHWRKGTDLFIQVGRYLMKNYPKLDIELIWTGNIDTSEKIIAEADIEKAGLSKKVFFIGEKDDPGKYFAEYDVFLLTSREDPFPLVAIEVGMLGKPIICFEGATGIQEILINGGGFVVPYLDIEEMAEKAVYFCNNRDRLREEGIKARSLFSEFTSENQCPKIYAEIKKLLIE